MQNSLSSCKALVLGRNAEQVRFLTRFAERCGFALIEGADSPRVPDARTLIRFVIVHHQLGDDALEAILSSVRSGDKDIRFSPVIVIADDCPFETVLHYIQLGVDDVISLPEKREMLIQRLSTQLFNEQTYVETATYFGPDRRRLEYDQGDPRRRGMAGHGRYIVQRLPDVGTKIVSHHIFTDSGRRPDMQVGLMG